MTGPDAAAAPAGVGRSMASAVARWAIVVVSIAVVVLAVVYRDQIWKVAAGVAGAVGSLIWSLAQKYGASQREWRLLLASPPKTLSLKGPPAMDLGKIAASVEAWVEHLPPDLKADAVQTAKDLRAEGEKAAVGAVDAAIAQRAPTLEPALAPYLQRAFDAAIAIVEQDLAGLKAAQASVLPPPAPGA